MCRPKLPNVMSSGWHLHQSLRERGGGANAFMAANEPLSGLGRHYLGGLLAHAGAAAAFTTPTINGYKRYRSYALAPDRVIWGRDNRGVMIRVIGAAGDPATRLENRIGSLPPIPISTWRRRSSPDRMASRASSIPDRRRTRLT